MRDDRIWFRLRFRRKPKRYGLFRFRIRQTWNGKPLGSWFSCQARVQILEDLGDRYRVKVKSITGVPWELEDDARSLVHEFLTIDSVELI